MNALSSIALPARRPPAPEPSYRCATCQDTTWVQDPTRRTARRCTDCSIYGDASNAATYLASIGMEAEEIDATLRDWRGGKAGDTSSLARGLVRGWAKDPRRTPHVLVLLGVTGSGKSMLAGKCLLEYKSQGGKGRCLWVPVRSKVKRYLNSTPPQRIEIDDDIQRADVAALDDCGTMKDAVADVWIDWAIERIRAWRRTIFTANARTIGDFEARLASRLGAALVGACGETDWRKA